MILLQTRKKCRKKYVENNVKSRKWPVLGVIQIVHDTLGGERGRHSIAQILLTFWNIFFGSSKFRLIARQASKETFCLMQGQGKLVPKINIQNHEKCHMGGGGALSIIWMTLNVFRHTINNTSYDSKKSRKT